MFNYFEQHLRTPSCCCYSKKIFILFTRCYILIFIVSERKQKQMLLSQLSQAANDFSS